jgi:hypothetical protein
MSASVSVALHFREICHFDFLPPDLLQWFINQYFSSALVVDLLALALVSWRFRKIVMNPEAATAKKIEDWKNSPPNSRIETFTDVIIQAFHSGTVGQIEWLLALLLPSQSGSPNEWVEAAAEYAAKGSNIVSSINQSITNASSQEETSQY